MSDAISIALLIEIAATIASLLYIVLLIQEKIACWVFGIVGSVLSVYLMIDARLYSEGLLYVFYAGMGVWGWARWHQRLAQGFNRIIRWRVQRHVLAIVIACCVATALGVSMHSLSDAQRPLFDAFTTVFSFLGTYLEITKVLEAWIYWVVLNLASIWLYHDRSLDIYAMLIGVYAVLSVWGYFSWRKSFRTQPAA